MSGRDIHLEISMTASSCSQNYQNQHSVNEMIDKFVITILRTVVRKSKNFAVAILFL